MVCYWGLRIIISNFKESNSGDPMLLVLWESDITFLIKSTHMMKKIKIILCIDVSGLYLCGQKSYCYLKASAEVLLPARWNDSRPKPN